MRTTTHSQQMVQQVLDHYIQLQLSQPHYYVQPSSTFSSSTVACSAQYSAGAIIP